MVKVSVIIPLYNNKDDIITAIESVQSQTFEDWELIVVDDCSTDGSYETVCEYILDFDNIKIIRMVKNSGCYICMNEGLNMAEGDYIVRLDSDDQFHKNKLEKQVHILNTNSSLVGTNHYFQRGNNVVGRGGLVTLMYRKDVIDKIGYYDSVRFQADVEFCDRIYKVFGRNMIKTLNEVLYFAKRRENSLTTSKFTGLTGVGKLLREQYTNNYKKWHNNTNNDNLYLAYPLSERPFSVDERML